MANLADGLLWPIFSLHQGLQTAARAANYPIQSATAKMFKGPEADVYETRAKIDNWVTVAGRALQIAADPITLRVDNFSELLAQSTPLILRLSKPASAGFAIIHSVSGSQATLINTEGQLIKQPLQAVVDTFLAPIVNRHRDDLDRAITALSLDNHLPSAQSEQLVQQLLKEQLGQVGVAYGWHIRLPADAPILQAIGQSRLWRPVWGFVSTTTLSYVIWIASWALLGRAFFAGSFELMWLLAWALARLSIIPLQAMGNWYQGQFSIGVGGLIKRRLLAGSFNLEVDQIKQQGVGQLIGKVLESETVETLFLQGGFLLISGLIEIVLAYFIFLQSSAPPAFLGLLTGWVFLLTAFMIGVWVVRQRWTRNRIQLTQTITEKMAGHQTRLVQLDKAAWHVAEAEELSDYHDTTRAMDRWLLWLQPLAVYGWILTGASLLLFDFNAHLAQPARMAVTIGGILATVASFNRVSQGVGQLIDARIALDEIRSFLTRRPNDAPPISHAAAAADTPILSTHQLSFGYRENTPSIIEGIDLELFANDRILLESRSGGGKSTLVSLLAGLRKPNSGLILFNGLDLQTLGRESWRQNIAIAPQFHENHIFLGTLAFNLLMGRRWPPTQSDIDEAAQLCIDIGLGPLVERMPSGLQQVVGETGWKLSHGEKSRIYLARAILQNAPITILDESFGALDPVTLKKVMATVREQETALVVIAHP